VTYNFGDSFDLYATPVDAINGYWDSGAANLSSALLTAGRFANSRAFNTNAVGNNLALLIKASNVNDAVHHIVCAFSSNIFTAASAAIVGGFTLFDGGTAQASVGFQLGGNIVLISGAINSGTILATYPAAWAAASTWYAFEFEISIDPSAGVFNVRKNGNTVNDFSATGLNTRGGTANSYASRVSLMTGPQGNSASFSFDDLWWRSGAATGAWLGDLRCYARMPATDISDQFTRTPQPLTVTFGYFYNTSTLGANAAQYLPFVAAYSGSISAITVNINAAVVGHLKAAIYDNTGAGGNPGAVLATAAVLTNPVLGPNTLTLSPSVTLVKGRTYWMAVCSDASVVYQAGPPPYSGISNTVTYASFPLANPSGFTTNYAIPFWSFAVATTLNCEYVAEPQEDGLTSYVFDNVVGHADFYGLPALGVTPATIIATTLRAYAQKSDAGTRNVAVRLKSGSATVTSPSPALVPSSFQWLWRTDLVDPNTGAAWSQAAIDAAQIGPVVVG
jgi:hypothetical protein